MIKFGSGNLRIPKFEKPVYCVSGGMTDFRKKYYEKNSCQLCTEALRMAVEENDLKVDPEEFRRMVNWVVYSQFADHFGDQLLAASKIHDYIGFRPARQYRGQDRRRDRRFERAGRGPGRRERLRQLCAP